MALCNHLVTVRMEATGEGQQDSEEPTSLSLTWSWTEHIRFFT